MGLSLVAPEADVKRQYRKLAAQVHPDKCKLEGAEEAFKLLGRAVAHALSNADKNRYTMVHICTCAAVLLVQAQVCSAQSGWELFQQDLYRAQHAIAQATLRDTDCSTSLATCSWPPSDDKEGGPTVKAQDFCVVKPPIMRP